MDRNGVDLADYGDIIKPKHWETYYIWIGDDRYSIRKSATKGDFKYGVFKEVNDRDVVLGNNYRWEFQNCFMFLWTARFYLWKLRKFQERAEKAQRPNGRYG